MRKRNLIVLSMLSTMVGLGIGVLAGPGGPQPPNAVPYLIPYQGILEKNGVLVNALRPDTVFLRVSLHDSEDVASSARVWPTQAQGFEYEEHEVNVHNGRFALVIGSVVPYMHIENTPLFLDIQVKMDSDPDFVQLGGRQRFMSAPYAVVASRSDTDFLVSGTLTATEVGIGTDPQVPFHVAGDAHIESNLQVDGILQGRIAGGTFLKCTGNSATNVSQPACWGDVDCSGVPGGPCGGPTCNRGLMRTIHSGRCYVGLPDDGYCYSSLCIE
jgi:hypothetical protein